MRASCLCSCALRTMGSEIAPHSRSPTTTVASSHWRASGCDPLLSQSNKSRSKSSVITSHMRVSCPEKFITRGGRAPFSRDGTTDLTLPDRPVSRSRAIGGAVHMRRVRTMPGDTRMISGVMFAMLDVWRNAVATSPTIALRVVLYASGAACKNHSLYILTDAWTSFFHRCGLSALINALLLRFYGRPTPSGKLNDAMGRLLTDLTSPSASVATAKFVPRLTETSYDTGGLRQLRTASCAAWPRPGRLFRFFCAAVTPFSRSSTPAIRYRPLLNHDANNLLTQVQGHANNSALIHRELPGRASSRPRCRSIATNSAGA